MKTIVQVFIASLLCQALAHAQWQQPQKTQDCFEKNSGYQSVNDPLWVPCKTIPVKERSNPLDEKRISAQEISIDLRISADISATPNSKLIDSKFLNVAFDLTNDTLTKSDLFGHRSWDKDIASPIVWAIAIKYSPIKAAKPLVSNIADNVYEVRVKQGEEYARAIVERRVDQLLESNLIYQKLPAIAKNPFRDTLVNVAYTTLGQQALEEETRRARARLDDRLDEYLDDATIPEVSVGVAFRFFDSTSVGIKLGKFAVRGSGPRDENGETEWNQNVISENRVQTALDTSPTKALALALKQELSHNAVLTAEYSTFDNKPGGSLLNSASAQLTAPDEDYNNDQIDSSMLNVVLNTKYIELNVSEADYDGQKAQSFGGTIRFGTGTNVAYQQVKSDREFKGSDGSRLDNLSTQYSMSNGSMVGVSQKLSVLGKPVVIGISHTRQENTFRPTDSIAPYDHIAENAASLKITAVNGHLRGFPVKVQIGGQVVQREDQSTFEEIVKKSKTTDWGVGALFELRFKREKK